METRRLGARGGREQRRCSPNSAEGCGGDAQTWTRDGADAGAAAQSTAKKARVPGAAAAAAAATASGASDPEWIRSRIERLEREEAALRDRQLRMILEKSQQVRLFACTLTNIWVIWDLLATTHDAPSAHPPPMADPRARRAGRQERLDAQRKQTAAQEKAAEERKKSAAAANLGAGFAKVLQSSDNQRRAAAAAAAAVREQNRALEQVCVCRRFPLPRSTPNSIAKLSA